MIVKKMKTKDYAFEVRYTGGIQSN